MTAKVKGLIIGVIGLFLIAGCQTIKQEEAKLTVASQYHHATPVYLVSDLASSFTKLKEEFNGDVGQKRLLIIPTAASYPAMDTYINQSDTLFQEAGFITQRLDIAQATQSELELALKSTDYLFVSGGNTFYLLQELKKIGGGPLIEEAIQNGVIYIGESAGGIVLSKDIEYIDVMDSKEAAPLLDNYQGLDLIGFRPLPHGTNPLIKSLANQGTNTDKWLLFNDTQYIKLMDGQVIVK